jgi:hypothetical protein
VVFQDLKKHIALLYRHLGYNEFQAKYQACYRAEDWEGIGEIIAKYGNFGGMED